MKFNISQFRGYNKDCEVIKVLKAFMEKNKNCTIEEMFLCVNDVRVLPFKMLAFKNEIVSYLKPQYIMQFYKEHLQSDIDGLLNNAIKSEKKYSELVEYKQQEIETLKRRLNLVDFKPYNDLLEHYELLKNQWNKSRVLIVMDSFYDSKHGNRNNFMGTMNSILFQCCERLEFNINDFSELKRLYPNYISNWEYLYRESIVNRNNSAWKSFEHCFNRKPFLLNNKRMYIGIELREFTDRASHIYYRCTGWNDKNEIKFLRFLNGRDGKNSRLTFTNITFTEYFKNKNITVL